MKSYENKMMSTDVEREYCFADKGITVKAVSLEEAIKKMELLTNKNNK